MFNPFRPLWFISAGAFASGWVLNIIGHGMYEKNAPAFADDPLSFIAGPVWDFTQLRSKKKQDKASHGQPAEREDQVVNVGGQTATA